LKIDIHSIVIKPTKLIKSEEMKINSNLTSI